LELHIEQGPVLEALDLPLGVVTGTVGVARHAVTFTGQAAHAGTTPMRLRRDALLAAARLSLEVRELAARHGGTGTTGRLDAAPGIVTAVAGEATMLVDQRHESRDVLDAIERETRAAADAIAAEERVDLAWRPLFAVDPVAFDPDLVAQAAEVVGELAGSAHRLPSGALHDATEVARAGVPTAMLFVQSLRGLSHTRVEDTRAEHLELGVRGLDALARRVLAARA
jgi:N-carbamoyl-L-amino-acid hydrolase